VRSTVDGRNTEKSTAPAPTWSGAEPSLTVQAASHGQSRNELMAKLLGPLTASRSGTNLTKATGAQDPGVRRVRRSFGLQPPSLLVCNIAGIPFRFLHLARSTTALCPYRSRCRDRGAHSKPEVGACDGPVPECTRLLVSRLLRTSRETTLTSALEKTEFRP